MSDSEKSARPRQLTMAGGFVIGGSVLLVLSVFDTITGLRSVEMREEVTKVLSSPTGKGLGLSVGEALSVMRVGLMIAAACAAAAVVLGVYALQRNRAARVALSVLAVPILLTSPLSGGLLGALVAAAVLMLWSGQARDWFAGRPIRELQPVGSRQSAGQASRGSSDTSSRGARGQAPPPKSRPESNPASGQDTTHHPETPTASSLSTTGSSTDPVPTSGFGERAATAAPGPDTGWLPPGHAQAAPVTEMPPGVKIACIVTWVFSGFVALLYAVMLVVLVSAQDRVVEFVVASAEWRRADLEQDLLVPVLWVGCLLFLGWALGACLLAWFTWRRHNWARYLLVASAAVALVAGFFAFPLAVVHQLAAVVTIVALFSSPVREWFEPRTWPTGPPTGPPAGPPAGSQDWPPAGSQDWPPPQESSYPAGPPQQGQAPPPGSKPPVW